MPQYETVRFGTIEVPEAEIIELRRGLLGFEGLTRFVHLEADEEAPFSWLQSLDDPGTSFVVANPVAFFPEYRIEVDPRELGDVKPEANERLLVFGICTLADQCADITMNLQGPIIVNAATRRGKQVVLNRSPYSTQHRLVDKSDTGKPHHGPARRKHKLPQRRSNHSRAL